MVFLSFDNIVVEFNFLSSPIASIRREDDPLAKIFIFKGDIIILTPTLGMAGKIGWILTLVMQANCVLGIDVKRLVFIFKLVCVYVDLDYLCLSNVVLNNVNFWINALSANS